MSEKKYKDFNDNDRTLYEMLNYEPQWVINRFQFMEELLFATKSSESYKAGVKPGGLNDNDTIEDALQCADDLAGVDWHSGSMCDRKDLRRIVLLAYEYRKLTSG